MKQTILIHGSPEPDEIVTQDSINPDWFRWLQEKLPNVVIPPMPLEIEVVYENWVRVFEEVSLEDQFVLIGHSCGGGFLLRYLSEHPEIKPNQVILVAPWLDAHNELDTDFMKFDIDSSIPSRMQLDVFTSSDDYESLVDSFKILKDKIPNATYHEFSDREHFCGKKEFPELLELLK